MRDIIFKAKRRDNKKWIDGYYCKYGDNDCIIEPTTFGLAKGIGVLPETVGQYTGLTDKNGKKIFEGDIHERDGHYFVVKHGKFESFENSDSRYGWYFEAIKGDVTEEFYGDEEKYVNIIGNIHDNKDLLEVK